MIKVILINGGWTEDMIREGQKLIQETPDPDDPDPDWRILQV